MNHDGRHIFSTPKSTDVLLSKGTYPLHLDYFQDTAALGLNVYYAGPGITKKKISAAVLSSDSAAFAGIQNPVLRQAADLGNVRILCSCIATTLVLPTE